MMNLRLFRKNTPRRGFTLIELLVVVVMVAILAYFATQLLPGLLQMQQDIEDSR